MLRHCCDSGLVRYTFVMLAEAEAEVLRQSSLGAGTARSSWTTSGTITQSDRYFNADTIEIL
jgi:hypothetical protein